MGNYHGVLMMNMQGVYDELECMVQGAQSMEWCVNLVWFFLNGREGNVRTFEDVGRRLGVLCVYVER